MRFGTMTTARLCWWGLVNTNDAVTIRAANVLVTFALKKTWNRAQVEVHVLILVELVSL